MINLKLLSAAALLTLALPIMDSTASYAQGRHGGGGGGARMGGGMGGGGARMGMGGGGVRMGIGGGPRMGMGARNFGGGGQFTGVRNFGGGRQFGYRGYHRGGSAFVPGLIAGGLIGGALASPYYGYGGYAPYGYGYGYGAAPIYEPEIVEVSPDIGGGDVDYCIRTFKSYNVRTGTYLGYDGLRHACP